MGSIPIASETVPYLETAIHRSPSNLVFSNPNGSVLSVETSLQALLRSAHGRAGIAKGYNRTCRRAGCGHAEHANDADNGRPTRFLPHRMHFEKAIDSRLLWLRAQRESNPQPSA